MALVERLLPVGVIPSPRVEITQETSLWKFITVFTVTMLKMPLNSLDLLYEDSQGTGSDLRANYNSPQQLVYLDGHCES